MIRACTWFLVLAGLALTGFGVYFIDLGSRAASWPRVDGRIVSTTIKVWTSKTSGSPSIAREYYPSIRYAWTVDGADYSGDRYRFGTTHETYGEREDAIAAARAFAAGTTIAVYYDPRDPSEAVLEPATSWSVYVPLLMGLSLAASGGWMARRRQTLARAAARSGAAPLELG